VFLLFGERKQLSNKQDRSYYFATPRLLWLLRAIEI
jgi:hypothetical protein